MFGNKGKTSPAMVVAVVFGGILLVALGWYASQATTLAITPDVSVYDGEFKDFGVPDYVVGTDLKVNATFAKDTPRDDEGQVIFATISQLNGTNGVTTYFAYMFELDGPVEGLVIEGELNTTTTTAEMRIRDVYLIQDAKGVLMDKANAIQPFELDLDTAGDEFSFEVGTLAKGQYVVVVEMKGVATTTMSNIDGVLVLEHELTTKGDLDTATAYIQNYEIQPIT